MKKLFVCLLIFLFAFSIFSCSKKSKIEKIYTGDEAIDESIVKETTIQDLILNPDNYTLTYISVVGTIISECSVGCWFFISDENKNQIYIELQTQNFEIPQAVGHKVKVSGLFENRVSNPRINAYKIEFLDL